jgi:hypothetical protein
MVTLPAANICIYCGRQETLSDEHIIPYSFGGNVILPKASCSRCAALTSRLELQIARGTYHMARAIHRAPTRRPNRYPEEAEITVHYGEHGPSIVESVSIEDVPASVLVPHYSIASVTESNVRSICTLQAARVHDEQIQQAKFASLIDRFSAHSVSVVTGSLLVGSSFERTLWKIAHGALWHYDRDIASQARLFDRVLGLQPVLALDGEDLYFCNLYSTERPRKDHFSTNIKIHTPKQHGKKFISVDIDFFGMFGLPIYHCLVPNFDGKEIEAGTLS